MLLPNSSTQDGHLFPQPIFLASCRLFLFDQALRGDYKQSASSALPCCVSHLDLLKQDDTLILCYESSYFGALNEAMFEEGSVIERLA